MLIIILGAIGAIFGLALRIMAFFTAQSNFTHMIQDEKRPTHVLITHGVYK